MVKKRSETVAPAAGWGGDPPAEAPPETGYGATDQEWNGAAPEAQAEAPAVKPKKSRKAKAAAPTPQKSMSNSDASLVAYVERIERLEEEKAGLSQDIREVFGEIKAEGYNIAAVKKVMARRRMDPEKRAEMDALIETYEFALE